MSDTSQQAGLPIHSKTVATTPTEPKNGTVSQLSAAERDQLYQPISDQEIRLLKIHPSADFEAEIVCELIVEDITVESIPGPFEEDQDLPIVSYEALSYCWGRADMTEAIVCNGIRLPVTETLLEALRYIRREDESRLLWTDSCCIHQADLEEKARQVEMMFAIFQRAVRVIAWVGTPSPDDELICHILDIQSEDAYVSSDKGLNMLGMPTKAYLDPGETDPNLEAGRSAARNFITTRPFFQRTWIRQEIFAARKLDLLCGKHVYEFKRFTEIIGQLLPEYTTDDGRFVRGNEPGSRALQCYSYFSMDHDKFYTITSINLHDVWFHNVMRSAIYKSALPQDKVFAVLGMSSWQTATAESPSEPEPERDITKGFPKPDYKRPVSLIYQDFVKHHINVSQSLKCLSIFQDLSKNGTDLPSWTIDLRIDMPRYLNTQQFSYWGAEWEDEIPRQILKQHGMLKVRGIRIARIGSQVGPNPWAKGYPRSAMQEPNPMLQGCNDSEEHWFPQGDDENNEEESDGEALLDRTLELLENDCGYTWRAVGKHMAPLEGQEEEHFRWPNKAFHYHVFVSSLAQEGDLIVHLGGTSVACILRQVEGEEDEEKEVEHKDQGDEDDYYDEDDYNDQDEYDESEDQEDVKEDLGEKRWKYLGPALIAVGVFNPKKIENEKKVFQHHMARVNGQKIDWQRMAENFILM